ncbi:MAG: thioredoxin family protein [Burkholderiaceae bacterium]|nr:thioredoxin family protein [Burkholderiaceae bacterium]
MKPAPSPHLLIACLCADWCGACREYRPLFDALALKFPQARFAWVDVEDEADLIEPIEVENFPTILIAVGSQPRFFGTVLPHIETLERLIQAKTTESASSASLDPAVVELAAKLQN